MNRAGSKNRIKIKIYTRQKKKKKEEIVRNEKYILKRKYRQWQKGKKKKK